MKQAWRGMETWRKQGGMLRRARRQLWKRASWKDPAGDDPAATPS